MFTAHKMLPSYIHENYNKFTKNHDTLVNKIKIQKHALLWRHWTRKQWSEWVAVWVCRCVRAMVCWAVGCNTTISCISTTSWIYTETRGISISVSVRVCMSVQVCVLTFPCWAACCFSAALGWASKHFWYRNYKKRKHNYTCCLATSPSVIQWCRMVLNLRICCGETKRGLRKSRTQSLWSEANQGPRSLILFLDLNLHGCLNLPCH